jgi:hypothetical protein
MNRQQLSKDIMSTASEALKAALIGFRRGFVRLSLDAATFHGWHVLDFILPWANPAERTMHFVLYDSDDLDARNDHSMQSTEYMGRPRGITNLPARLRVSTRLAEIIII